MKITVITIFPEMIADAISHSIIGKAQKENKVTINIINLRDFGQGARHTVDDRPFGGGAGMVLKVDCIKKAIDNVKSQMPNVKNVRQGSKVILTSPRGNVYNQKKAKEYSNLEHMILVCGHYEGVDERVSEYVDEELSVGDFVMTGGEIGAIAIIDSVVRLLPGVLNESSPVDESFIEVDVDKLKTAVGTDSLIDKLQENNVKKVSLLEYPQYTRPEKFEGTSVPEILLSGDHQKISNWRLKESWEITKKRRPDLIEGLMIK